MQKTYEVMVLLHPDLEIDVEAPIAKIEGLIESVGGKVAKRDNWGKKRLAYRIKRQDFAIYVYLEVQLDPQKVRPLEDSLLILEEVIRHMIVVHEDNPKRESKKPAEAKKEAGATDEAKDESKVEEVTA